MNFKQLRKLQADIKDFLQIKDGLKSPIDRQLNIIQKQIKDLENTIP